MDKTLLIASIVVLMGAAHTSRAQSNVKTPTAQSMAIQNASIDQDYEQCIDNRNCPAQARLSIMMNMNDRQGDILRKITRTCISMNYKNCMTVQTEESGQWRQTHKRLGDMMATIDPYYQDSAAARSEKMQQMGRRMNRQEPSGYPPRPEKAEDQGWWSDLWGSKQEPEAGNE